MDPECEDDDSHSDRKRLRHTSGSMNKGNDQNNWSSKERDDSDISKWKRARTKIDLQIEKERESER